MTPLLGEELECDRAVETGISRAVHQTHAPTAEPFDDVVVGYRLTDHPSSNQSLRPLLERRRIRSFSGPIIDPDLAVHLRVRTVHPYIVRIPTATLYTTVSAS